MKNFIFSVGTALFLTACAGGARDAERISIYDFGMPATRLATQSGGPRLALEVKAPSWFDSLGIDYRLAYDDPLKLREYARSRWAGAPDVLLAQRLRQQLGASGTAGGAAVECVLRIELLEFTQVFSTPVNSRAVLKASAILSDVRRRPVAERSFSIESPAASPDAPGGVAALVAAGTELGQQLDGWLKLMSKEDMLKTCRYGVQ